MHIGSATERPRSHVIAIGIRQLQHRNFSVAEPLKSAARFAKSRGHFCDVLASECPCRAAGDFQPAPIRRLEALCTARRGTRMSINRVQGASRGQPLKRRVDAAYLQPYGFRFQLSRFLPAEHRRLLRRLATWQLLRRASSTFSAARRSETAWRQAVCSGQPIDCYDYD